MQFSNINVSYSLKNQNITVNVLDLPVDNVINDSSYVLKSVDGLDPPDITVSISDQVDAGGVLLGLHGENREVVLTVGFKPNYANGETISSLRAQLYTLLTPKYRLPMIMSIQNASRTTLATTIGQFKKIETSIFSKEPEVQIVMSCYTPYLMHWNQAVVSPATLPKNPIPITNIGNAPSGFSMKVTMTANASLFSLYDTYIDALMFNKPFYTGDIISFDTTPGRRFATLVRSGLTINLLPYQDADSVWLQLAGGVNSLQPNTLNFTINELIVNANYWGV